MNKTEIKEALDRLFADAKRAPKGSYSVYSSFSNRVFNMGLDNKTAERALIRLANILKV